VAKQRNLDGDENELLVGIDVAEAQDGDEAHVVIATSQGQIIEQQGFHGDARGPVARLVLPYKGRIRNINVDKNGVGA
jgi:hypothetical protein